MRLENRWFTKTGKAKRVPKDFEQFKAEAQQLKNLMENGETIKLIKHFMESRRLGLYDASCVMVAFVGCYSNATQHGFVHTNGPIFSYEKYKTGCQMLGVKS